MILVGDIGGTTTRLAILSFADGRFVSHAEARFNSAQHGGLEEIVARFLKAHRIALSHAAFGIAGPVENGRSELTNLPWVIDAARVAKDIGIGSVTLLNDVEAAAWGLSAVPTEDRVTLQRGGPGSLGNLALIALGTGLGEAGLYWDGSRHQAFPSEGGHADFAPRNALEVELLRHLIPRYGHVSYERILSGPGLYEIYLFLRDSGRGDEPGWLTEELHAGDPAAAISRAALTHRAALCEAALTVFASLLGAEAGNLALKLMARGGVFLAGGIPSKVLPALQGEAFLSAFCRKGRMQSVLENIPVHVIRDERLVLMGAARAALIRRPGGPP